MSILNERIKQRREALGMSQAELAELLGYSDRSTIAKIENGTNDITQSKIEAFAKALRTTPAYLMGWENDSGEQDLGLTALDVAKWLEVSHNAVESVMEDMGWPDPTKPEVLSKISAEVGRRKICSVGQQIKEVHKNVGLPQKEDKLSKTDREIIELFLKLDVPARSALLGYANRLVEEMRDKPSEQDIPMDIDSQLERYRRGLLMGIATAQANFSIPPEDIDVDSITLTPELKAMVDNALEKQRRIFETEQQKNNPATGPRSPVVPETPPEGK